MQHRQLGIDLEEIRLHFHLFAVVTKQHKQTFQEDLTQMKLRRQNLELKQEAKIIVPMLHILMLIGTELLFK